MSESHEIDYEDIMEEIDSLREEINDLKGRGIVIDERMTWAEAVVRIFFIIALLITVLVLFDKL